MGEAVSDLSTISVEREGRVLSGVGVSEDVLHEAMDRLTPDAPAPETPAPTPDAPVREVARDDTGRFAPKTDPTPEKPPRGATRFSQLTSERDKAAYRAEQAEKRAQELEARLAAAEQARTTTPEPTRTAPETPPTPGLRKRPTVQEIGATYADWDAYEADLGAWFEEREQGLLSQFDARLQERIEADRASRAVTERTDKIRTAGRQAYADFDAVVNAATVDTPMWQQQAIAEHPESARLFYTIAKDPALNRRLAEIANPVQFGVELGQLLMPSAVASPASTAAARISQAPAPIQPVSGGTTTTSPPLHDLAEKGDYPAYKARREADRKRA